jgi:single-strand DNA-binding protein
MASFNKVILIGNMCADPELKQTANGVAVCSFSIAVQRRFSKSQDNAQQTDFINIVAWRQTAEFVAKYFTKGRPILVCGSLQTRSWTDQNGQKRYATEVIVDEATFVDSKSDNGQTQSGGYVPDAQPNFEEVAQDDDLPF